MQEKTNAVRIIEKLKMPHQTHVYDASRAMSAGEVAAALGQNPGKVFKTLVAAGKSGKHYVFVVPALKNLDLKKAAKAVGEKSVEMLKQKELLPLTGYVHGGCSPIGMKKFFAPTVDVSAESQPTIIFSGGRIGLQLEMPPSSLAAAIPLKYADLTESLARH